MNHQRKHYYNIYIFIYYIIFIYIIIRKQIKLYLLLSLILTVHIIMWSTAILYHNDFVHNQANTEFHRHILYPVPSICQKVWYTE